MRGNRIVNLDSLLFPAVDKLYQVDKYNKRNLSIIMSSRVYFYDEIVYLMKDYGIHDFLLPMIHLPVTGNGYMNFWRKLSISTLHGDAFRASIRLTAT